MGGFRRETQAAITAARRALDLARAGAASADVSVKRGRDVVTSSDVAAEDLIRQALAAATRAAVIGEERGGALPADGSAYWLVDPICGTRNYASGTSLWCVNLALIEGGVVSLAVAADASTGHLYAAERGQGAWLLDGSAPRRRLSVSTSSQTVLVDAGKSTGQRRSRAARCIAAVIEIDEWDVRTLGTSLSLLYAASGRAAAAAEFYAEALHTAAGALIAGEAGATVTDADGLPWTLESDSIVVSADPGVHRRLLTVSA
jgi:myo-inositol-1(or 4)-monophosphatase